MNILLIYPNINGQRQVQMGLASISSVLKEQGHNVALFDTTFIINEPFESISSKLRDKMDNLKPDLLLVGCRSLEFDFTNKLLKAVNNEKLQVVVGGQHPTVSPEEVIKSEVVDYICVGEGEEAISDLVKALEANGDATNIKNIWTKKDGKIFRNPIRPLMQDLDRLPFPDYDLFDARHISDLGKFETSRGCPYSCTYCINDYMQHLYGGVGGYHREKSVKRSVEEIAYFTKKYNFKRIFLIDETFTIKPDRVREFCRLYKEQVGVPFGCMTRPEVASEDKFKWLKDAGCDMICMGIESGNEDYRKNVLDRHMSQQHIINAFLLAKKIGIRSYSFNMIGLPNETRKDVFSTIELNRNGKVDEVQITLFYPFKGTRLRDYAEENNLFDENEHLSSYYEGTILRNPNMTKEQIMGLHRTFIIYVRSPKIFWPFIRLLEFNNAISINLCRLINTFMKQGIRFKTFKILWGHFVSRLQVMVRLPKPATG
ncbi:B12-binding domain-containing radical SAM protein [Candidatus Woesearchaeota archaeon]|nr:B12-binding domain-containing radical SAM protein [Candidatus Woesearchaeota archaeon]